ncbi:MAG: hypothetical protein AAFY47_10085 [Pseudomonadota bacterium]
MQRFTTALSIALMSSAAPAWAQEEPSEMQQQYQGEYVTVERDASTENGVTSGSTSVQTQNGTGGTRTFERGYDETSQSASRSSQTTTNTGQSVSSGANAGCDGNGTCSTQRSATGPGGETVSGNRSLSQTETGYARSGGVTGPQGRSTSTQGAVGYTPENGAQRSSQRTGPQGNSLATQGSAQCVNSTCNRTASQTGPQGLRRSVDNDTTLGQFGGVVNTRNVTAPNGQTRKQTRGGRARRRPR